MTFALVHHPDYVARLPAGHSFPMSKYALVMAALAAVDFDAFAPSPLPAESFMRVHDAAYVDAVFALQLSRAAERRIGFPVTAAVLERARLVAGGSYLAGRLAIERGFAANAAGGSHHAHADSGSGYCVFNDLAVAAAQLRAQGHARRVMIVDLDVHQGDGTATIFTDTPEVFTFSMHAAKNFPARKAVSDHDVALADGTGDPEYLAVLAAELPVLLDSFAPDLVLFQAGVDPHADDRLGRLGLSDAGLATRDALVVRCCAQRRIPRASTLGGGSGSDVAAVAARHAAGIVAQAAAFSRHRR